MMRPMFGAFGKAGSAHSVAFVSKAWISLSLSFLFPSLSSFAALDDGVKAKYGLSKKGLLFVSVC
ncbi:urease [Quercus suber]|uniref:Urease n=1 Tax=Quercus suber TaxID=58331 RepID=A0AAW0KV12_QUESU